MPEEFTLMSWGNVAALGVFNWIEMEIHHREWGEFYPTHNPEAEQEKDIRTKCVNMLLEYCDKAIEAAEGSCYNCAYGNRPEDFHWGCCSSFCDQAICFLYAYELTNDKKYLDNAFRNVNYILGQNATGYCYVTGFGSKSPMHPHSRLCASDGIEEPIPGLLVGGPNPGQQDIAEVKRYKSDFPDESYEDVEPSYASNEIAINWNASLVAAITWLSHIGNEL
jgi:endoglucanase